MRPRFFLAPENFLGTREAVFRGEDLAHFRALRLRRGDELTVCDGAGKEYPARILSFTAEEARVLLGAPRPTTQEPPLEVILVQGLPKGDKFGEIVRRCTEIGVVRLIPLVSRRVVAVPPAEVGVAKQRRWQKIAREAAQQSQRGKVPRVDPPLGLEDCLGCLPAGALLLLLWEGEKALGLREVLEELSRGRGTGNLPPLAVFVGPEGGWAPEEVARLKAAGARAVTLGPRVLRTENAGAVALTAILFLLGDLGRGGFYGGGNAPEAGV